MIQLKQNKLLSEVCMCMDAGSQISMPFKNDRHPAADNMADKNQPYPGGHVTSITKAVLS